MSSSDDSSLITIPRPNDEKASVIFGSLFTLVVNVLAYGAIAVHTLLCRRRYGRFIEGMPTADLPLPVQFFMLSPGPIYAAGFLLVVIALILKECAIERKAVSLQINLFALAAAACLFMTFLRMVHVHFEPMLE
jgi:hypothetical protein